MIRINLGRLTGLDSDLMARITKLTSVYGETRTASKFGNLTGTYPGIQAAFYEPGGNRASPPELKATQNNLLPMLCKYPHCISPHASKHKCMSKTMINSDTLTHRITFSQS